MASHGKTPRLAFCLTYSRSSATYIASISLGIMIVDPRLIAVCSVFMATNPGTTLAFGSDDQWTAGWGMGVSESIITKGPGNYVLVNCGIGVGSIMFTLLGNGPRGDEVLLTFDGLAPEGYPIRDGQIQSASRVDAAWFDQALEMMRKHKSVNVRFENGLDATFTLAGASKAIAECPSVFSQ